MDTTAAAARVDAGLGRHRLAALLAMLAAFGSFPAWGPPEWMPLIGEAAYYLVLAQL